MSEKRVVEVHDVVKRYQNGKVRALRGVSLTIPERAFLALAGPSGSGKTTLLNMIGALDVPDEGTVAILGEDLAKLDEKARTLLRRDKLGFVFQHFNLVPVLTAVENVELPLEILPGLSRSDKRERSMQLLGRVGLGGMEHRYPSELSGGQQQRVAIARALVKRPKLVLADEPTANLDGESGGQIIDLMSEMRDGVETAFVFSTHDQRLLERTETVVHLVDGCIQEN